MTDRQTDRQTDRPSADATPSVTIGRIYVVLRSGLIIIYSFASHHKVVTPEAMAAQVNAFSGDVTPQDALKLHHD